MKSFLKWVVRRFGYEIHQIQPPPRYVILNETIDLDYESLKAFATRAAQFSRSAHETQVIRNLYLTGLLREMPSSEYSRVDIGGPHTLEVGIWRKGQARDGAFVRRTDCRDQWFYWADKDRIEPKRRKWRVALLGESVARGYLYDPHFNCASTLEGILESHLGQGKIDIVDLAKSNQTIQELKVMVGQCLALRPDIVVIFAGNNWRTHITETDIPYVDSLLRQGGVPAMKSFLDGRQEQAVRRLTSQVNAILGPNQVKVIWVVPEFNLGDWADPPSDAPHLVGQGNKQWRDLSRRASIAMRKGDFVLAEKSAKKTVELDGGTSAVPSRILAEICRSNGDLQGTRRYLEMCRDAEGWDPSFSYSPRVSSPSQNALREAASIHQNVVIDLPRILSRHSDNALPDRRMFLDYCHLTAEGINLAMAAVAREVVVLLTGRVVRLQKLESGWLSSSPEIEGKASLLAAVHNAHFYQSYDVVNYWCERAIQFWPESAQIMTRYIDIQTRHVPIMACKSTIELYELDDQGLLPYLLRGGKQRLDMLLGEAIIKCVDKVGLNIRERVSNLRVKEHSIRSGPKELTDFYYSSTIPGPSERAWTSRSFATNRGSHCVYASAFGETSKFVFFGEKGWPVGLRFTYRVPNSATSDATVELEVNGHHMAKALADRTWRTLQTTILDDHLVDGLNEVIVTWNNQEDCSEEVLGQAADMLVAGRLPFFHRVFGEIHSLLLYDPLEDFTRFQENNVADRLELPPIRQRD